MNSEANQSRLFGLLLLVFLTPIGVSAILEVHEGTATLLLWSAELIILLSISIESRGNRESERELIGLKYRPTGPSSLERGVSEARATLDTQIETLDDIDTKAIRILRVNVLLIGVVLSALTFSANSPSAPFERFLNVYLGAGILLLISSSATAGLTYTASDFRAGMSRSNIRTMLEENLVAEELHLVLAKSYATWIRKNQSAEVINSFYSTSTILLLIYAVTYLALGVYHGLVEPVPFPLVGASNVALLGITLASGYPTQIRRVADEFGSHRD
jgi:hypothetical protein